MSAEGFGASVEIDIFQGYFAITRIVVLAIPGGLASSLAITLDVLQTANGFCRQRGRDDAFEVRKLDVAARTTCRFHPADIVIVPGLGSATAAELLALLESSTGQQAVRLVRRARKAGAVVAASCASTFLLAEAGLLEGRRATTTWWLAPLFRQRYPAVELVAEQLVVADWPIATAGAAMAQMDLMMAIVAKFGSSNLAQSCARYLLLDRRASQLPYMAVTYLAGQDSRIARAESWLRRNIDRKVTMEDLAAAAGLSPRTFARRLKAVCDMSPVRFAQRIRAEVALTLRRTTQLPVDEIARRVGYAEPSTLRRLLRRDQRVLPQ